MHRTVHIPHQMHEITNGRADRGVVLVAVVTKRCRSLFDSQYGILSGARDVFGFGICGETVPFRSASVGFCETHLIHP